MAEPTELEMKLKSGLVLWAADNEVRPVDFALKLKYSYAHAWDLLSGKRPFTQEAFGRFSIAYGIEAAARVLELAKIANGVDVDPLEAPKDAAYVVPVVTRKNGKK